MIGREGPVSLIFHDSVHLCDLCAAPFRKVCALYVLKGSVNLHGNPRAFQWACSSVCGSRGGCCGKNLVRPDEGRITGPDRTGPDRTISGRDLEDTHTVCFFRRIIYNLQTDTDLTTDCAKAANYHRHLRDSVCTAVGVCVCVCVSVHVSLCLLNPEATLN